MNGSRASVDSLVRALLADLPATESREVLLCPSFVFLEQVGRLLAGSAIQLGAQNLSAEKAGAFTGEIAGAMLTDAGCRYVLVGHSERRALMGESSDVVAQKFVAAQQSGLIPVLCVGETLAERKADSTLDVIREQFSAVVDVAGIEVFANAVVAYEPVWAIGTGETATPQQAQEVHAALRAMAAGRSARIAADLRLLYGGSVKSANAAELFSMPDIDGGLIGGASLDAHEFLAICAAAAS
jgi:triosephosphate isomerase